MNTSKSKHVSFSKSSTFVIIPALRKSQKSKLWLSKDELSSSKIRWEATIQHLQSLDDGTANQIDASHFMGLERFLTKEIQEQANRHRLNYTKTVIQSQYMFLNHEDFAQFLCSKTREAVERSHSIGLFYATRHYQQSKLQESKSRLKASTEYKSRTSAKWRRGSAAASA